MEGRIDEKSIKDLPKFNNSEIVLGELLGTGGFSQVHSILHINLQPDSPSNKNEHDRLNREDMARNCNMLNSVGTDTNLVNNATNSDPLSYQQQYVFKALKSDLSQNEHTKGVVDLAVEARFLATLSHPHIITMRATSDVDPLEQNFFVILDRLGMTLDKQLQTWRKRVNKSRGIKCFYFAFCKKVPCFSCFSCISCANKHRLHAVWMERLTVAKNIALAIQYLHSQSIVYRDLKPDNVGFNDQGDVKIFDFGLAKCLHPDDKMDNDLYNLTGNTGSLRYMAPEVALGKPYDHRVDSYSFGILFWQLCSLTTPYSGYTCKMHSEFVVRKGNRPQPDSSWQESWIELMTDCWAQDIFYRPNFNYIVTLLENEVTNLVRDDGMTGSSPEMLSHVKPDKKKRPVKAAALDVDTRIETQENTHLVDDSRIV